MELISEKWGGHPHYRSVVHHLGDDEHGTWLWGAAGRTVYIGDEPAFVPTHDGLMLVPPGAWWSATWPIDHPRLALYVNINTPAVWDDDAIRYVDVDLDVVRLCDGTVEIVDRDEFEEHQVRYGYPADLVARTEAAATEAHELVLRNAAPLDGVAADAWLARARAADLPTPP